MYCGFFLATPELLHKTTMKADDRKKFMELKIIRPEKSFISYPSAPLLFHKMEGIQKEAINTLSARGLISIEKYKQGYLELTGFGRSVFDPHRMSTEQELSMSYFITHFFANEEEIANYNLRRRTGLRRIT